MIINLEQYKNITSQAKTIQLSEISASDTQTNFLYHLKNRNLEAIKTMAVNNEIAPENTFYLKDLDEIFNKSIDVDWNFNPSNEKIIPFALIVAQLNLFKTLKHVIENKKENDKANPLTSFINLNQDLTPYLDFLLKNIDKKTISLSLEQTKEHKTQAKFNIIKQITLDAQKKHINQSNVKSSLKYNDKTSFKLNNDFVFTVSVNNNANYSFMDAALKNDNLEMFKYLIETNTTTNFSFIKILDAIKNSYHNKKPQVNFYPKKIINHIIDEYYTSLNNQVIKDNIDIKKNKWCKAIYKGYLEIAIIKNHDTETLDKLLNNNRAFYEKNEVLLNAHYKLSTGYDFDSWAILYSSIEKNKIKIQEPLFHFFEKSQGLTTKSAFLKALSFDNLYKIFAKECNKQEPDYQNNFEKLDYLIKNTIYINQNYLNKKIDNIIENTNTESPNNKDLEFIASVLNIYPDLIKKDQKTKSLNYFKEIYGINPNLNKAKNYLAICEKALILETTVNKKLRTSIL